MPTQDMVIGLYHLTHLHAGWQGRGPGVQLRRRGADGVRRRRAAPAGAGARSGCASVVGVDNGAGRPAVGGARGLGSRASRLLVETTLGRVLFNETLPPGYRFVNYEIRKGQLSAIVNDLAERFPKVAAGGDPGRAQGGRLPLGHLVRRDDRHGGRHRSRRASRRSWSGTRRRPSGSTSSTSVV